MISSRRTIAREDVASHYDELDHFYRDVWGDHVHHGLWLRGDETREQAVLQLVDLVASEAGVTERHASACPIPGDSVGVAQENTDVQKPVPPSVCDIGCGYGASARLLAARGAEVTAMTISQTQFAFAQQGRNGSENPRFLLGDWLTNKLPAESFDAAIAIESSEHMPDKRRFFQQAHRVLRPDGHLVICAWLVADKPRQWMETWLLEPICREGRMPHLGGAAEYESLAKDAGFRLERFEDLTRRVERTWPAIVRRLLRKFVTEPRYLQFLCSCHAKNRVFAVTIPRIWIAYRSHAMRYGIFTFVKGR